MNATLEYGAMQNTIAAYIPYQINYLSMSYLGVLHHDTLQSFFIYVLCLLGVLSLLPAPAYTETDALPDYLTITPQNEQIVLGSSSEVIITGLPNTEYYLWFCNTNYMSGYPGDQPPIFKEKQDQFHQDLSDGPYTIGNYAYADACCGRVIRYDVPPRPDKGVRFYGLLTTDEMGRAVIGFDTELAKTGNYQIHVERTTNGGYQKADTVITVGSPPS